MLYNILRLLVKVIYSILYYIKVLLSDIKLLLISCFDIGVDY